MTAIHTNADMVMHINMNPSSNGISAISNGANSFKSTRGL